MFKLLTSGHWPAICEVCARWPAQVVCPDCLHQHAPLLTRCPCCALPMAPGVTRCHDCTQSLPPPWQRCTARVSYSHPWVQVLRRFKFQQQPAWARHIAGWMLQTPEALEQWRTTHLVLPVPAATSRLQARGYNPPWEIIRRMQGLQPRPSTTLQPQVLLHRETGRTQHTLNRQERQEHAHQAFWVPVPARTALAGRKVLLVDDVMTTGTTLRAASHVLLEAGACSVETMVFARTPAPSDME